MSMPVNCANVPVEVMEARSPFVFEFKRLLVDSGGAGRFRGGLGQEVLVRNLGAGPLDFVPRSAGRIVNPPLGLRGGRPGSGGAMEIEGRPINVRRAHRVEAGEAVRVAVPGGGGFGDPAERSPEAVAADIAAGRLTPETASAEYARPARPGQTGA